MKPLLVFGIVFTYLISLTVVGNAAKRRPRLEKRQILQNRATVKIQLPSPAKKSVVESAKKDATTKKEVKQKSEHYIDPKILDKLNSVRNFKDFVKVFNPKGYKIKKIKVPKPRPGPPTTHYELNSMKSEGLSSSTRPGHVIPDDGYAQEEAVFYNDQRVADPIQSTSSPEFACEPKNTVYSPREIGAVYHPPCVILRKCGGCCHYVKTCVAKTTTNKTVALWRIPNTGVPERILKQFVEDDTCTCDCAVKPTDCYPTQVYSKDRCQCECNISDQACPNGKIWSDARCDCICDKSQSCNSDLKKWDESTCSCVCIDTPCPVGQTRRSNDCQCS